MRGNSGVPETHCSHCRDLGENCFYLENYDDFGGGEGASLIFCGQYCQSIPNTAINVFICLKNDSWLFITKESHKFIVIRSCDLLPLNFHNVFIPGNSNKLSPPIYQSNDDES